MSKTTDQTLQESNQYSERLKLLQNTGQAILSAEPPNTIAYKALRHLRQIIPCQRASIAEYDYKSNRAFVLASHSDYQSSVSTGALLPLNAFGFPGELRKGKALYVPDVVQVSKPTATDMTLMLEGIRSYINIPLIAKGSLIGSLNLGATEPEAFTQAHMEIAREVAGLLAVAIHNAQLFAQSQAALNKTETLYRVAKSLIAPKSLPHLLQTVVDGVAESLPANRVSLNTVNFEEKKITHFVKGGKGAALVMPESYEEIWQGLCGWVLKNRQPVCIPKDQEDPREGQKNRARRITANGGSIMVVPVIYQEILLGTLAAINTLQEPDFTQEDLELLSTMANQAAVAIENAHLYKQIQGYADELEKRVEERTQAEKKQRALAENLLEVMGTLNSTLELEEVLDKVLDNLLQLVPFDNATVLLHQENVFKIVKTKGLEDGSDGRPLEIPESDPILQELIRSRKPRVVGDVHQEIQYQSFGINRQARSWLGVPLLPHGRDVIGFLSLSSKRAHIYNENHIRIALNFAGQAAIAIENARFFGEVKRLSITDMLTGTHNRRYLFEIGQKEVERSRRCSHQLAAIMLDIDHFKQVNDSFGHAVGDRVLQLVANRCRRQLRNYDIFARYGGDEFVILLPETSLEGAKEVAKRLLSAVEAQPMETEKSSISISLSFGVAILQESLDLDELLKRADHALYAAKEKGGHRVKIFQA